MPMPEVVAREQYDACAAALEALTGVVAASVLERDDLDRPCIQVTVAPYERVPPRVHRTVAEYDFGTRPDLSGRQGRPGRWQLVVV